MENLEFKSEGEGEDSKLHQRPREYFEDETPVVKTENEAEDFKEDIPQRKCEYFEGGPTELKPEKNACSSECPFCHIQTEDFKEHLRSSERCGALHQVAELEAKIKTQENQLEATKQELRMLRQKYEKVFNKTTNTSPSQESPSAEGEHDVPEDEAEAAKEVFQGTEGEEESTSSI